MHTKCHCVRRTTRHTCFCTYKHIWKAQAGRIGRRGSSPLPSQFSLLWSQLSTISCGSETSNNSKDNSSLKLIQPVEQTSYPLTNISVFSPSSSHVSCYFVLLVQRFQTVLSKSSFWMVLQEHQEMLQSTGSTELASILVFITCT